jgi:hypothetical protein
MGDAKFAKMLAKCGYEAFFSSFKAKASKSLQINEKKRTTMLSVLNGQSRTKSHAHSIVEHLSALSDFASQAFARRGKLQYFFNPEINHSCRHGINLGFLACMLVGGGRR